MASPTILALADDLTGALEVGAKFAAVGIPAMVTTRPGAADMPGDVGATFAGCGATTSVDMSVDAARRSACATVIDTETRHMAPADAAYLVGRLAENACPRSPLLVYKKTDSTLRGNIGAE